MINYKCVNFKFKFFIGFIYIGIIKIISLVYYYTLYVNQKLLTFYCVNGFFYLKNYER